MQAGNAARTDPQSVANGYANTLGADIKSQQWKFATGRGCLIRHGTSS